MTVIQRLENDIPGCMAEVWRQRRRNAVAESDAVSCAAGTYQPGFNDEVRGSRPVAAAPLHKARAKRAQMWQCECLHVDARRWTSDGRATVVVELWGRA
jgi:hypothetical protein